MRKLLPSFLILLFFFQATASFGVITGQEEKTIEKLETSYRIGFVNTGEPLQIRLEASSSENYEVSFEDRKFTLETSEVTADPEGSGWYSLGDRYAKIQYRSFSLNVEEDRETNEFNFTVDITATPTGTGRKVSQKRSQTYRVRVDRELPREKPEFWKETEPRTGEDDTGSGESTEVNSSDPGSVVDEKNLSELEQKNREKQGSDGTTTVILLLVIAFLGLYVVKKA